MDGRGGAETPRPSLFGTSDIQLELDRPKGTTVGRHTDRATSRPIISNTVTCTCVRSAIAGANPVVTYSNTKRKPTADRSRPASHPGLLRVKDRSAKGNSKIVRS